MGPSPCCATSVKRDAPPVISNSHRESVGFHFLLTPPRSPRLHSSRGGGRGGFTCPKSPQRQWHQRKLFLRLQWSCSGKVRFGSLCMVPPGGGGRGVHLLAVPSEERGGCCAFLGDCPGGVPPTGVDRCRAVVTLSGDDFSVQWSLCPKETRRQHRVLWTR